MCSHVSGSGELHIGHVMEGYLSLPKKSCFLVFPMYWPVRNLMRHVFCESVMAGLYLLETYCLACGLVINWLKSSGHWKFKDLICRPTWIDHLGIRWAEEEKVGKLLGAPFGLALSTRNVGTFLQEKINKN